MSGVLYVSALVLLVAAGLATFVYARAVAHGHRAYLHVVLAGAFVLAVEAVAVPAVSDESSLAQGTLLAANVVGIGAMVALAARFRSRGKPPAEASSVYAWYRDHRGFVAFAVIVVLAGVGLIRIEGIADDAQDAADDAAEAVADNSGLICSLGELISDTPIARRPDETPVEFADRIRLLRRFAADLRELDDCDPEHPVRVRVPEEDRPTLQEGRDERREGGDAVGPAPGGGGGQPGGQDPPPAQPPPEPPDDSLLGPTLDDVCDLADGVANVC